MSAGSDVPALLLAQLRNLMGTQSCSQVRSIRCDTYILFPPGRLKDDDRIRSMHMNRIVDIVHISPPPSASTQFPSGTGSRPDARWTDERIPRTMMAGYTEDPLIHGHRPIRSYRIR